ncbi:unnamed protein product [Closterium sp. Naga37s-1]|nr:unnamed protein product [Closterium sp. Naga37s-1]
MDMAFGPLCAAYHSPFLVLPNFPYSPPDAAVAPLQEQAERALHLFDMDMAFGPCTGLSRLERWQRASRLGLNPPPHGAELHGCKALGGCGGLSRDGALAAGQPDRAQPSAPRAGAAGVCLVP